MGAFSDGPAYPADGISAETSDQGKACEAKHKDIMLQIAERLGGILANGDAYEFVWFLQGLFAISKAAAEMADEMAEESRKKH